MRPKAIFFDTSDTLYQNPGLKKAISRKPIMQLSEFRNISYGEAKELFGRTREELKPTMSYVPKAVVMVKLGVSRLDMQEALTEIDVKKFLQPDRELDIILERLHGQFEVGIITNILRKFLYNILDALEIDKNYFRYVVSVDNTRNSKPHEEPFLTAIELSGLAPEECVYVGDSLTKDMMPAKKIGMKTIWLTRESEKSEFVDVSIGSIYEVEEAISKIG